MFAHIAGIPVEETALSLAPIVVATGGIAGLKLRERSVWRRARKRHLRSRVQTASANGASPPTARLAPRASRR